jgi:FkbM family methyltransferase
VSIRLRVAEKLGFLFERLSPWWRVRVFHRLVGNVFEHGGFNGKTLRRPLAPHGYVMALSLDDWMERFAAFTGLYYAIETVGTVAALLKPGDAFVDVGSNIGFVSLVARRQVGESGSIFCIEPNPRLVERLRQCLDSNGIQNATVLNVALGDQAGEARLALPSHHGSASLRGGESTGEIVRVVTGDDALQNLQPNGNCLVKIDVEGYELLVLRGMAELMRRPRTAFLVEITAAWLEQLNGSAAELFALMHQAGFQSFIPSITPFNRLKLTQIEGHDSASNQYDVLFVRSTDAWTFT